MAALQGTLALLFCATLIGCGPTAHGSAVASGVRLPPNIGNVWLSGVAPPADARELGIVQAVGALPIDELAPEFARQVAALGGNFGTVEQISTRFEFVTQMQSYSYGCGTPKVPRTCSGMRPVSVEVATTQLLGHAYLAEGLR